jgi:hypothetical protein
LIPLSSEPAVLVYHLGELTASWLEAEKTAGGRESPVVRNLPSVPINVTSLGASSSGILPQGASKPVEEDDLQHVASKAGRLHLAPNCLEVPGGNLKS